MDDHADDHAQAMAQRYGTTGRSQRRLGVTAAALLAVAGLGWIVWATASDARPVVSSQLVSFTVASPHAASARLVVSRRSRDVAVSCLLRASAEDHTVVGELTFTVDASSPATVTLHKDLRTERTATSLDLVGCTADGQDQRR